MADLPEHMLAARVLTDYHAPEAQYPLFFTTKFPWAPYSSYFLFVMLTKGLFSVFTATRLYLSLTFVLTIVSFWCWIRSAAPGRDAQVIPATLLLFGYFFYVGTIDFLFSTPFLFLSLTLGHKLLNDERFTGSSSVGLGACLLLAYLSHIVTFVFCGILLLGQAVLMFKGRRILRLAPSVFPSVFLFLVYWLTQARNDIASTALTWDPLKTRLATLLFPFNIFFDFQEHRWFVDVPLLTIWILVILIQLLSWLRRKDPRGRQPKMREAVATNLLLLASSLLLPSFISGGLGIGLRGPYFIGFTGLVLLPVEWDRNTIFRWSMVIVCAAFPVLMSARCTALASEMKDLEKVIAYIPPARVIQPIITEAHIGNLRTYSLHHAAAWYSYYRGGVSPYLTAGWAGHFPVRTRRPFLTNPPGEWEMERFRYEVNQAGTDYFLVRTRDERILADLREHVPLAATVGRWQVFGPNPHQ